MPDSVHANRAIGKRQQPVRSAPRTGPGHHLPVVKWPRDLVESPATTEELPQDRSVTDLTLRAFAVDEERDLQTLIETAPDFAERVTGYPPGPSDALSLLLGRPDGVTDDDKIVLGGWLRGTLVSVVDVLRHYPDHETAHIGLVLVDGRRRRQGIGRQTLVRLGDHAASWTDQRRWRAAVLRSNSTVTGFWTALGFAPTGEVHPYTYGNLHTEAVIFERPATNSSCR